METILVVDDAPEIREMIAIYLSAAGYEVLSTPSGREAISLFEQHNPALVILDIGLPDLDGLRVAAAMRLRSLDVGIILVTVRHDDFDRVTGLETGADSYITKPVNLRVLLAQVRSLLRRRGVNDEQVRTVAMGSLKVDLLRRRIADSEGRDVSLTGGEFALLIGLLDQRGKPVDRQILLAALRNDSNTEEDGDVRTIDTLIARLRRKLELNPNRPILIQTVYGKGYRLARESELAK